MLANTQLSMPATKLTPYGQLLRTELFRELHNIKAQIEANPEEKAAPKLIEAASSAPAAEAAEASKPAEAAEQR